MSCCAAANSTPLRSFNVSGQTTLDTCSRDRRVRTRQAGKVGTALDRDEVDAPDHLLEEQEVSDQEQQSIRLAVSGGDRRDRVYRRARRDLRRGRRERLTAERDRFPGKVLEDGILSARKELRQSARLKSAP